MDKNQNCEPSPRTVGSILNLHISEEALANGRSHQAEGERLQMEAWKGEGFERVGGSRGGS